VGDGDTAYEKVWEMVIHSVKKLGDDDAELQKSYDDDA